MQTAVPSEPVTMRGAVPSRTELPSDPEVLDCWVLEEGDLLKEPDLVWWDGASWLRVPHSPRN